MQLRAQALGKKPTREPRSGERLIPDITFVVGDIILLRKEFFLKRVFLVMGFLGCDVPRLGGNIRFAHAEYAVSGQPGELVCPFSCTHRDEFVLITRATSAAE